MICLYFVICRDSSRLGQARVAFLSLHRLAHPRSGGYARTLQSLESHEMPKGKDPKIAQQHLQQNICLHA